MGLACILKRLAMTQMGLAHHLANRQIRDDAARNALLEETRRINADLQTFTDSYRIDVTKRPAIAAHMKVKGGC